MSRPSRMRRLQIGLAATIVLLAVGAAISLLVLRRAGGLGLPAGGLTPQDLSLLVVTLDTTRADRLGCYGYREISTPRLDALARDGALFEQAHASVPLTLPSHCSIFTAKYPPAHGVRDNGGYFLPESEDTLAEILKQEGFATGGFVSAYVLDHRWGIAQGFDRYFDDFDLEKYNTVSMGDIQRRGDETVEQSVAWLEKQKGGRFFAWVHLYDPHSPYEPPEPYATAYPDRPYVGEIAYADSLVGRLVDEMSRLGLLDRTLVVIAGDHGESLGEHNESGHAFFVYSTTTHVPLIISGGYPGLAGKRIPDVVRTIDIMPTVLALLGVGHATKGQGRSLVPLLDGTGMPEPLTAYSESFYPRHHFGWSDLRTVRTGAYRFIEAPRAELFDVVADPGESTDLSGSLPLVVERMRETLASAESEMNEGRSQEALAEMPAQMDDETQRKLAALGYVGSTVDTSGKRSADLPDPKDKIGIVNRMHEAKEDFLGGKTASAIAKLKQVIADSPEVIDAYFRLGNAYMKEGNHAAALEMYRKTLALKPDHDWAVVAMADAFLEMGRVDEAIVGYRRFLDSDPGNDKIAYRLAETLLDAGRLDEAETMFRRVLEIRPDHAAPAVGLAAVALRRGDSAAARREADRALAIDPQVRNAHYNMALALQAAGDPRGAMEEYRNEIRLHAHSFKARFNLARMLEASGDRKGQIQELTAAVEQNPDFTLGRYFLAKALLDSGDLERAEAEARKALDAAPDHYYAPLGQYVLADIFSRRGDTAAAEEAANRGKKLEERNLPPPPP